MSTAKMALIAVTGVAAALLFTVLAVAGDERAVFLMLALYVGGIALVTLYRRFSRRSAVEREARRLGLSFSRRDPFRVLDADFHPFLRFGKLPGTQRVENVIWGVRDGREVRAFDYRRPAEDEIRYSCAMVRIPDRWPSLLVRRHGPLDVARNAAGLQRIGFELDEFNRRFEVRSDDRRLASAVIDQRMIGWLLESDPALGFQLQEGWLLAWMPQLPPDELERTLTTVEGFHERIPRAVWSLYGDGSPARPDLG
ncbi:MAG TPA: hypothetical protein VFZ75_05560 [Actinomycetota bacterium]|nr:hypothetical protein [Actinomycetota bacterium]